MTTRVLVGDDPTSATLRAAVEVLSSGRIVAYPTDTLYGLAVDPRQDAAVDRLCRVKGRARVVGVPLIAANLRQVESCLGALPPLGRQLARRFWPGPLTLVFEPEAALVPGMHAVDGSLAVRVPRCFTVFPSLSKTITIRRICRPPEVHWPLKGPFHRMMHTR